MKVTIALSEYVSIQSIENNQNEVRIIFKIPKTDLDSYVESYIVNIEDLKTALRKLTAK